jgi:hypothetical protein
MRRALVIAAARGLILLATPFSGAVMSHAAGFPDVSELPARSGMPDPLVMLDGSRVASPEQWAERRRPELKALFEHYMYGEMPPAPASVQATVEREDRGSLGGKATKKEVTIAFGPPAAPKIHLLLVVPNKRTRPAPVFLGVNFRGNHAALADPSIALPTAWMPPNGPGVQDNKATDAGRGKDVAVWSIEKAVDRGYAVATFYAGDIAPDHPGFADGVFPHYVPRGDHPKRGSTEWGTVAAWAWGTMRAVDYLRTDADLDKARIAVVGHSRMGKSALLAGAFDERVALTVSHQAGCGGSAPSRGKVGEQVKQINDRFPHWFDAEFHKFNDQVDRLPFDQNGLVALAAPRPVLLTNGVEDLWANPAGQFEVLKAADPAYRLLGVKGIGDAEMPPPGTLVGDRLAYHIRPGKHFMGPEDWQVWLDHADKHLGKP